jgi:hypothetical protein
VYFNQRFNISAILMRQLGVYNGHVDKDNQMFVDPKLLVKGEDEFAGAHRDLLDYFARVISLIQQAKSQTDKNVYWVAAQKKMRFKETSNTGLGGSKSGTNGNAIGKTLAKRIVIQAAMILPHVEFQPEMLELIGVFTEGLGCDRISDMIVSILKPRFLAYTTRMTRQLGIQQTVAVEYDGKTYICPRFKKGDKPIILVPRRLLKPLPIAADIGEALDMAADLNEETRKIANKMFDQARERGAQTPSKAEILAFMSSCPATYKEVVERYKRIEAVPFDFDRDQRRADFDPIAAEIVGTPVRAYTGTDSWGKVEACVNQTIEHLRQSIEDNRLSDVLFDESGKPRRELISQRIVFSIAKIFAKLYNVDVTPEGNSGPGAVDFKFSIGNAAKLLIETKLSTHERLTDGYYLQLPAYAKAEGIKAEGRAGESKHLLLLILRVTDDDRHLKALATEVKKRALHIKVVVIDAVRKPSASKRRK